MAPPYRLLQDDEDLNSLLGPPDYASLQPTAAEMSPSPRQGQSAGGGFQMPERDPELESAWKGLEMQKIHEAQKPEYGWAEGLRDTLPTALALGMDAGFNHGRGAGAIVQGGMGEVAKQEALRNKERLDAGDLAVKLHGRGQDAASMARLQYQYDALHARESAAGGVQDRWATTRDDRNDPNSQRNNTARGMSYDLSYGRAQGAGDEKHDTNDRTATDRAIVRGAETNAEIDARHGKAPTIAQDEADKRAQVVGAELDETHANAPRTAADKAEQARLEAEARVPSEQAVKRTPTVSDTHTQALTDLAQSHIPGLMVDDETAYKAMNPDATRRAANEKYVSAGINTIEKLKAMEAARAEVGPVWNSLNDEEKRIKLDQMANDQLLAVGGLSTMGNTATLNAGEFPRYAGDVPNGGFDKTDAWDAIIGKVPGMSARDTQLEKLQGTRRSVEDAFNRGLAMMGSRYGGQAPQQPGAAPPPAAGAPPSDQLPGEAVPADLGVTGGYKLRDVPPINAAPGGGGPLRHIRKPNGTVVPTMKSDAELAALPEGYQVID